MDLQVHCTCTCKMKLGICIRTTTHRMCINSFIIEYNVHVHLYKITQSSLSHSISYLYCMVEEHTVHCFPDHFLPTK